ncbi:MAG: carbamoyltransferase [Deltaproteobacteria bacterium]|nr:carbamoyltransferase [Deltaproteobacteria bacterium]
MTSILGISAFYHDSAAAIVVDGQIIAAAQEERFTRIKHDYNFPLNAVNYCLAQAGLTPETLNAVVFYEKPLLKFDRLLETWLAFAPVGFRSFLKALPLWLKQKLFIPREIDRGLNNRYTGPIYFSTHHAAHAASAFFPSPFKEAAILTLDGVGEWTTTSFGVGQGNKIELIKQMQFPHSLGLLYTAFTYYTGFKVNSGEYKLMGLAPYGTPRYVDLILKHLIDLKEDGSFWLNQKYFDYCAGLTMTSRNFNTLFQGPPRRPESTLTQKEMDLAASIQKVTELVMIKMAQHVHNQTGQKNLCLAGGVALNCVANGKILKEGPFENIWIQPAAGDAGGALGAALLAWHHVFDKPRTICANDAMQGALLGPEYTTAEIKNYLDSINASSICFDNEDALYQQTTELLAAGKVLGHFSGRMEFGPRALGNRSIIGDARNRAMQQTMNLKIKYRESFRPFAPSCLEETVSDYFELTTKSPYMLLVAPVKKSRRINMTDDQTHLFGIDKLNIQRSDIPAITHVDYSARIQTVSASTAPRYYQLIKRFAQKTGYSIVVNTSFNIRGEPIVCTPQDAYRCFMFTEMDALLMENFLLLKEHQPPLKGAEEYKKNFKLD